MSREREREKEREGTPIVTTPCQTLKLAYLPENDERNIPRLIHLTSTIRTIVVLHRCSLLPSEQLSSRKVTTRYLTLKRCTAHVLWNYKIMNV